MMTYRGDKEEDGDGLLSACHGGGGRSKTLKMTEEIKKRKKGNRSQIQIPI